MRTSTMTADDIARQEHQERKDQALEVIARADPAQVRGKTTSELIDMIFEMQNRASAALANVPYTSPEAVAELFGWQKPTAKR